MRAGMMVLILLTMMIVGVAQATLAAQTGSRHLIEAAIQAGELNARREGEINFWASTPNSKDLLELEKAFNNRFELKVKVKRTPLKSVQVANRLVIAGQAGQAVAADCAILSPPSLDVLIQLGLLEDFDWNGVFGREFPAIKRRVERLAARFRNKALELWHLFYVIAYRTDRLKKEELPKKWADLTDSKWAGRLAVPDRGYPFNYFSSIPGWSEKRVVELARAVKGNQVIFAKGSPGVSAALQTGEVSLGVSDFGNVEYAKDRGLPIDWIVVPGIPVAPKLVTIPKGAPNVNLARLFGAWITTEGRPLFEKLTRKGLAWPNEDSFLAARLKELGFSNKDFTVIDTVEEAKTGNRLRREIHKIYLGW